MDGVLYTYYYEGGKLVRMTIGDTTTMDFFYDQYGRPFAVKHNTRMLYYVLNEQGDVTRLIHGNGDGYATYHYDAWGNITYATDNQFTRDNPLRYRGYVYDTETSIVKPGVAGIHVFYIVGRKRKMPLDFNTLKC